MREQKLLCKPFLFFLKLCQDLVLQRTLINTVLVHVSQVVMMTMSAKVSYLLPYSVALKILLYSPLTIHDCVGLLNLGFT